MHPATLLPCYQGSIPPLSRFPGLSLPFAPRRARTRRFHHVRSCLTQGLGRGSGRDRRRLPPSCGTSPPASASSSPPPSESPRLARRRKECTTMFAGAAATPGWLQLRSLGLFSSILPEGRARLLVHGAGAWEAGSPAAARRTVACSALAPRRRGPLLPLRCGHAREPGLRKLA